MSLPPPPLFHPSWSSKNTKLSSCAKQQLPTAAAAAAAAKSLQSCLTLQPHGLQPTRLFHPWDKNTGVGCLFLLQCMKVESESEVTQSCLTLCDPMDCSLPGSSIHGIFPATVLEWGAIAFSSFQLATCLHTAVYMYLYVCQSLSRVQFFATPWAIVCQAPLSLEFSRQEYWSG